MIGVPGREGNRDVQVIIGVDTHQDEHVAVAIDRQGIRLGERHAPATTHGYGELEWWSLSLGEVRAFGIEGTGSYGAGTGCLAVAPHPLGCSLCWMQHQFVSLTVGLSQTNGFPVSKSVTPIKSGGLLALITAP